MIFIYNKQTKQVKMRIEDGSTIDYDTSIMSKKTIEPTEEELQNINDNDIIYIKGNKLVFEDNPFKQKAKERTDKRLAIDNCKNINELKDYLKNII